MNSRMPGLRSLHATVKIPLLVCLAIGLLIIVLNMQIRNLQDNLLSEWSDLMRKPVKYENVIPDPIVARDYVIDTAKLVQQPVVASHRVHRGPAESSDTAKLVQQPVVASHGVQAPTQHQAAPTPVSKATFSEGEVAALTQVLEMRIAQASGGVIGQRNCSTLAAANNVRGTCIDTSCPRHFHPSPETRIRQLLVPRLQPTAQQRESISTIGKNVERKKYIFVTAASSNHYNESQALVYSLRKFVFSKLHPDSYSFYYFDLGLKPAERRRVVKNCNCTVKSMAFELFPAHVRKLMCYAWKPIVIKALLPKAEVLVYMDVSIRFRDMDMDLFFSTARKWGAQFLHGGDSIPNHTVESMFTFYGDLPCMYSAFPELLAGFSVFHNEPFMTRVVLDPWVGCALNVSCMCPVDPHATRICPHVERLVGQCHRFDLSSLTIQMAKLYGAKFGHLVLQSNNPPKVVRNDRMAFFTD